MIIYSLKERGEVLQIQQCSSFTRLTALYPPYVEIVALNYHLKRHFQLQLQSESKALLLSVTTTEFKYQSV